MMDYRLAVSRNRNDAIFLAKLHNKDRPPGYGKAAIVKRADGRYDVYCVPDGLSIRDVLLR